MYLYKIMSAQEAIGRLKAESIAARKALSGYEGTEFSEAIPLAVNVLKLSGTHLMRVTLPAIVSSLPALSLIVWVSNNYGYEAPASGDIIAVSISPDTQLTWNPASSVLAGNPGEYEVTWPEVAEKIEAADQQSTAFSIGTGLAPVIHKPLWWNMLIANPAGYLDEKSTIELVQLELTPHEYLPFGPDWLREWPGLFFIALIAASLAVKVIFKIN